jgi:hypothetical protein
MKKRILILLLACAVVAGCTCNPPVSFTLDVPLRPQLTSMWCWAASGQMIMQFLGHGVDQPTQANNRFGRTDCGNSPTPSACINGGWPEFDRYGITSNTTSDAALNWAQVREQIYCKRKPFAFSWHWSSGGGHMMVGIGYVTIGSTNYVVINDPLPVPSSGVSGGTQTVLTYAAYVSGNGYTHWNDYYNITYTGGE